MILLPTALTTEQNPRAVDFPDLVQNQSKQIVAVVQGIPSGLTLDALDLAWFDSGGTVRIRKTVKASTLLSTIGQITDIGLSGTAKATVSITATDTSSSSLPAGSYTVEAWAVYSDGRAVPCNRRDLSSTTVRAPLIANPGGGSSNPYLPPAGGTAALVFDVSQNQGGQSHASVVGPAWQLGSTSNADTNDPTLVTADPDHYVYATGQYLTAGDALDSIWTDNTGWTVLCGVDYQSETGYRTILSKFLNPANSEFGIFLLDGKPYVEVYDGAGGSIYETFTATAAIAAGRRVIAVRYDRAQTRGSRITCFVAGSSVAGTSSTAGVGGSVPDTAAELRIGARADAVINGIGKIGNVYGWNGPLVSADISTNSTWLRDTRGWL